MLLNKWIFSLLLITSIAILTTINNYFFYDHVASENKRGAERVKMLISNILKSCKENDIASSTCNKQIIDTMHDVSKYYYYTTETTIKDIEGNTLWEKSKNEHDKVAILNISINLPDLKTSTLASFNIQHKWDNSNVALSVLRSMTFSVVQLVDIYNNRGIEKTLEFFKKVAWKRTRPALSFAVFSFILLWIYKRREEDRIKMEVKKDAEIKANFEEELERKKQLEKAVRTAEETTEILETEKELTEQKYTELYNKLKQYDNIINPPINTLNFDDLISLDTGGIGNKFRKTIEKLLLPIFQYQFNYEAKNLSEAIYKLSEGKVISKEVKNYADIIRVYGNIDSHYNDQDNITKDEVIALANYVIKIVEEIVENKLLSITIKETQEKNYTTVIPSTEHPIIKKESTGKKKYFDKETKKWITE